MTPAYRSCTCTLSSCTDAKAVLTGRGRKKKQPQPDADTIVVHTSRSNKATYEHLYAAYCLDARQQAGSAVRAVRIDF